MTKEAMEKALSLVDDSYLEEALEYEKTTNQKSRILSTLSRVAAALVIIFGLGGAGVYAYNKIIKDVKVEDGKAYVGDASLIEGYSNEEVSVSDQKTTYTYESYEQAALDHKLELWFENLPGEATDIQCVDRQLPEEFHEYSIRGSYQFGTGKYYLAQIGFDDAVTLDENMYFSEVTENAKNVRTYTNQNGVTFTLVDGTVAFNLDGFDLKEGAAITSVIISTDNNFGFIEFDGMNDEDIYKVLDCFIYLKS